jgi:glycerol kinase
MTADRTIAAIDQGSSSTKGAIVTRDGQRINEVSLPISIESSDESVQHDPAEILASVEKTLHGLLSTHKVAAIGLTCQRSTCLLWERDSGLPLTPALSWQDTSQSERVDELASHAAFVAQVTGLPLSPHYAAPKLSALIDSLPRGRHRAEAGEIVAGTLDAFLIRRLTGADGTEPGHAGRSLLFNLDTGSWSPRLADLFGVPVAALPPIRPSVSNRGHYRGVPVAAVAGDQQAALVGHGGWQKGVTAVHFGTGAFVLAGTGNRPLRHDKALSAVLASTPHGSRFQVEATVNSAGSAVDWACRLTGEHLDKWQKRSLDPDEVPAVFPAFRGAGAPWWEPEARALISGLSLGSPPEQLVSGVLVGVAMRVIDCVELLGKAITIDRLRLSGKLTRLRGLVGLLADASGMPVEIARDEEVGLLGIARLAIAGLEGTEGCLSEPPPLSRSRDPRWSEERVAAVRARWRAFSRAAIDLARSN